MHFNVGLHHFRSELVFCQYKKASSLIDVIKHASLCDLSKHHLEGTSCYTFQCYAIRYTVYLLLLIQSATHSTLVATSVHSKIQLI